jgi:DNA-binding XRE family transcriptional regulator
MTRNAVRRLRARLGLTQTRFAALLGVHKITVAKWEGGTKGMSFTSKRLLRVLAEHGPKALAPPPRLGTTRRRRRRQRTERTESRTRNATRTDRICDAAV